MRVTVSLDSLSARVIRHLADKDRITPETYLSRILADKVREIVVIELADISLMPTLLAE